MFSMKHFNYTCIRYRSIPDLLKKKKNLLWMSLFQFIPENFTTDSSPLENSMGKIWHSCRPLMGVVWIKNGITHFILTILYLLFSLYSIWIHLKTGHVEFSIFIPWSVVLQGIYVRVSSNCVVIWTCHFYLNSNFGLYFE